MLKEKKHEDSLERVSNHTINKFKLIESYITGWAQKLMNNKYCRRLVFIDCMCNRGKYLDNNGSIVDGTAVKVEKILYDVALKYPDKCIDIYFNDNVDSKVKYLKDLVDANTDNFHIHFACTDGNQFARDLGNKLAKASDTHSLLLYDPYEASIDWSAINPFLNGWSEVILNHMVSDSVRAVSVAKSTQAINKYQRTYLQPIMELVNYCNDRAAYENRIRNIIYSLHKSNNKEYYIASFPFFNSKNALVYDLILCTSNIAGFKLYKNVAWKTFGGKSSSKNLYGKENQLCLNFGEDTYFCNEVDEYCYCINDIAKFLSDIFRGKQDVKFDTVWSSLDKHPVFPSDFAKISIRDLLKQEYGVKIHQNTMDFI